MTMKSDRVCVLLSSSSRATIGSAAIHKMVNYWAYKQLSYGLPRRLLKEKPPRNDGLILVVR